MGKFRWGGSRAGVGEARQKKEMRKGKLRK